MTIIAYFVENAQIIQDLLKKADVKNYRFYGANMFDLYNYQDLAKFQDAAEKENWYFFRSESGRIAMDKRSN